MRSDLCVEKTLVHSVNVPVPVPVPPRSSLERVCGRPQDFLAGVRPLVFVRTRAPHGPLNPSLLPFPSYESRGSSLTGLLRAVVGGRVSLYPRVFP